MLFTSVFKSLVFISSVTFITSCNNGEAAEKTNTGTETIVDKPAQPATIIADADIKFGKYGCTATKFSNGTTEYIPRGFITLGKAGTYTYEGFEDPGKGTFTVDEKGNLHFTGGYLDGGEATKIDRPNKYFLTFPANPDNRWTMGWVE